MPEQKEPGLRDRAALAKKPARMNRATLSNGNGWKQRKIETKTCPSGQVVQIRRPGPEFMLRAGKVARTFSRGLGQKPSDGDDVSAEEQGIRVIEKMTDDELAAVLIFARELVCAMLVFPRLVQNPRPGTDEVGPDDIGDDFWFLFNYAMEGYFGLRVPVGNAEVEVGDLKTFRQEPSVSGDSVDGEDVRANTEQLA